MQDKGTVARRDLDFEDYTDIIRRNFRWIIGPTFAGLVIATLVAYLWPDTYISRATIRLVPQQIDVSLVQNTATEQLTDRLQSIRQDIESRESLTNIIDEFKLYPSERKRDKNGQLDKFVDDVLLQKMRSDIGMTIVGAPQQGSKGSLLLEITYKYRDSVLAQKICETLVTNLMNRGRSTASDSEDQANQFFMTQRDTAQKALDAAEKDLQKYRNSHIGSLPEEMQSNVTQMTALQQRVNSLSDAQTRAAERKMYLETNLNTAVSRLNSVKQMSPSTTVARVERTNELDKEISELETNVASMKDRYTAEMPELQSAQERLAVLRRQRDEANKAATALAGSAKTNEAENPMVAREKFEAQAQIDSIKAQIKAGDLEDQQLRRDFLKASSDMAMLQSRLAAGPAGEREYAEKVSNRDLARQKFLELDAKAQKSHISKQLEVVGLGEAIESIDQASLPTVPTEPKRYVIIPMGAVIGLVIGTILVAIWEMKDTSLKNLKDARVYTQLSILGSIPLLENDVVVQRRKQVMLVSWAAATVLGLAVILGSVVHYYSNKAS